jgi:Ca2+-transporting ATPase
MTVERAITADGHAFLMTGHGYEPTGTVRDADGQQNVATTLVDLARAGVLCNDARITPPTDDQPDWTAVGDPLEAALVAFAARCGVDADTERAGAPRIGEQPFDATTRRMITYHRRPDGRVLAVCKGAPEAVLAAPLVAGTDREITAALDAAHALAGAGVRVLALATGECNRIPGHAGPTGLRALGLVGIADPVRDTAAGVAAAFKDAGIRLILITGDHPATASAVASKLGIPHHADEVVRGDDGALSAADTATARVYARIRPEQKLDIIAALQRDGQVVAMTGDGVNDAPALRRADIGVAMGASGTEVARQAADLVLTDDNLATVTLAVGEGRRIYDNIRRFLRYALSGGIAELLVMLLGPFLGLPVPLLPAQILWVNLLTHGLPGVALGAEPAGPDVMRRPPRSPQESVLGAGLAGSVLIGGTVIATCVLAAAVAAAHTGAPWQSIAFVVLGLAQLGVALAVRAPRRPGGSRNRALAAAIALSGILQVAAVSWEPLRILLGTQPLTAGQLAGCAAVATLPGAGLATVRAIMRHRGHRRG